MLNYDLPGQGVNAYTGGGNSYNWGPQQASWDMPNSYYQQPTQKSWWDSRTGSQQGALLSGGLNFLANLYNINRTNQIARDQQRAARDMRRQAADLQKQYQTKIDEIGAAYKPGTPEYEAMMEAMARKDAAAGRNSQYGARAVDLATQSQLARSQMMAEQSSYLNNLLNQAYGLKQDASNLNFQAKQNKLGSRAGLVGGLAGMVDSYYRPAPRYYY